MAMLIAQIDDETDLVVSQTLVAETPPPRGIYWPLWVALVIMGIRYVFI